MALEIERKLLVTGDGWRGEVSEETSLRQGYLSNDLERIVRVRLVDKVTGLLTIKGKRVGDRRPEYEYTIPADEATFMLDHLCHRPLIAKRRYMLDRRPGTWTVDVFEEDNAGLVLAEVELDVGQALPELPEWAGEDVTADDRYANSSLQQIPYSAW